MNATAERVGETLQCSLFEPTEFLQDSCVQSARDLVDTARKHPAMRSVVPDQPYYTVATQPAAADCDQAGESVESPPAKERATDISTVRKLRDGLAGAVAATQAWDNSKRVRGAMMVSQMLCLARQMAQEVGWISCLLQLNGLFSHCRCCVCSTLMRVLRGNPPWWRFQNLT